MLKCLEIKLCNLNLDYNKTLYRKAVFVMKWSYSKLKPIAKRIIREEIKPWLKKVRNRKRFKLNSKVIKLHIGCGMLYKKGWVNIDNNSDRNIKKLDINYDLRRGIPVYDNSVDYIYNEHFIEHLNYDDGLYFLQECYRVLKPGGVIRIACPDLDQIINSYLDPNWRERIWVTTNNCQEIESRCRMFSFCVTQIPWGHKYVYNKEELRRRLNDAGFKNDKTYEVSHGKSDYSELCNLDTRIDSMYFEAQK